MNSWYMGQINLVILRTSYDMRELLFQCKAIFSVPFQFFGTDKADCAIDDLQDMR